jgi:hypothetical protein
MIGLWAALVLLATPLESATKSYQELDYERCVAVLAPAISKLHGTQRASASLYLGLCYFALGDEGAARRQLDAALRLEPHLKPPPTASPKELALFDDVSRKVAESPRPPPQPKKVRPAHESEAPDAHAEPAAEEPDVPAAEPAVQPTEPAPQPPPAQPAAVEPPDEARAAPPPEAQTSSGGARWPWISAGAVTVVSLGVFAVFGLMGVSQYGALAGCRGHCPSAQVANVNTEFWVADVSLIVAAVAAVATVVLFFVSR